MLIAMVLLGRFDLIENAYNTICNNCIYASDSDLIYTRAVNSMAFLPLYAGISDKTKPINKHTENEVHISILPVSTGPK